MLNRKLVKVIRPLEDDLFTVPVGTLGIHLGSRFYLDLGYIWEKCGSHSMGALPVYEDLVEGVDYEDLGEWDGTQGNFVGWDLNPLLMLR